MSEVETPTEGVAANSEINFPADNLSPWRGPLYFVLLVPPDHSTGHSRRLCFSLLVKALALIGSLWLLLT